MRTAPLALLTLAACGRFGFGAVGGAGDAGDGAPGDGDARDAAGDGTVDAVPACSGADIVCDLFEDPSLTGWTTIGGASIDTTIAHRGAGSLHVQSMALAANENGYFGILRGGVVPAAVTTLYLRAYVRLASLPVNNMELIAFEQSVASSNEDGVFVVPAAFSIYSQFEERSRDTGVLPALNTWTCLLFTVVRGNPGSLRLEGDVGPVQLGVQTDGSPPIAEVDLGIGFSGNTTNNPQPAIEVWIDDLLVRDTPVTCAD